MLLTNISRLVTISSGVVENAALQMESGKIKWFGPISKAPASKEIFDCQQTVVTPGLVDCHTHLVHAGYRQEEYALRAKGKNYLEIAAAGGGILSTVRATRTVSFDELYEISAKRLQEALFFGTTTIEIKSGYGLDIDTEIKILQVIQKLQREFPLTIVPTFMGAHTFPEEFKNRHLDYVHLLVMEMLPAVAKLGIIKFCDVFVEEGAFTSEEATQIIEAAKKYKMECKLHVDQLTPGKGAELAAKLKAVSADHLENISAEGIAALKKSNTVAVVLPGASFFLGVKPAPARKMIDAGLKVAISTDYNPGTNPSLNLMLAATQAVNFCKMTCDEAWKGITLHAAEALQLEKEVGSIAVGKNADLILWGAPDENYPTYRYGRNCIRPIFIKGKKVL